MPDLNSTADPIPETHPHRGGLARRAWVAQLPLFLATAAAFYFLLPSASRTIARSIESIRASHVQLDNEEGALLFQALELRRTGTLSAIYRPITAEPYVVGTYPPLLPTLGALFADRAQPDLAAGRVLAFLSTLLIAVTLAGVLYFRVRRPDIALLAPLLFLATYEVHSWTAYYRADLPAILLSLLGLVFVTLRPDSWLARGTSIAFFALACLTKQTVVAAPCAAAMFLLWRDRLRAVPWLLALAAAVLGPFLLLTAITRGQYAVHTVLYNMNTIHWPELTRNWGPHILRLYSWLVAATGLALAASVLIHLRTRNRPESFADNDGRGTRSSIPLTLYAGLACLNGLTIAKAGTAENYLIEPLLAVILLLCDLLGRLAGPLPFGAGADGESPAENGRQARMNSPVSVTSLLAVVVISVLLVFHARHLGYVAPERVSPSAPPPLGTLLFHKLGPTAEERRAWSAALSLLRREPGETWTELGLLNLQAGRGIVFQPFIMSELARQGRWDPARFLEDIRARRFRLVIALRDLRRPDAVIAPAIAEAFGEAYELSETIPAGPTWRQFYVFRPAR